MAKQREGGISWTDETWNPIRGCSRVSEGCRNCYAERVAARFSGDFHNVEQKGDLAPFHGFAKLTASGPRWTGKVGLVEKHLADPMKWRGPKRIFVNSMSDLFHEALPDESIDRVFAVMALCPQHTFQILTKRPERMVAWCERLQKMADDWAPKTKTGSFTPSDVLNLRHMHATVGHGPAFPYTPWPLSNVWLGVSVEDQATADQRVPLLLRTPAAKRFVSYEPALGPIDLALYVCRWSADFRVLDWVICGGESGPGARPMSPEWARQVRDQCIEASVAFFFKQWGEWSPQGDGAKHRSLDVPVGDGTHHRMLRVGKKAAGALLDGREWKEFPDGCL